MQWTAKGGDSENNTSLRLLYAHLIKHSRPVASHSNLQQQHGLLSHS